MDDFLRRVIAQREREQEEAILRAPAKAFASRKCRGCGEVLRGAEAPTNTVCKACRTRGGQLKLELEDGR